MSSTFSFLDSKPISDGKNSHHQESATVTSEQVERQWKDFTRFYQENEKVLRLCESMDMVWAAKNDKAHDLEIAIDSFASTANVVLEALIRLGNLHPAFGVAIFAYHSLITLEHIATSGHKMVLLVMLQMQAMMCTIFQLRHIKRIRVRTEAAKTSLAHLIVVIATQIVSCGSDLHYYMSRTAPTKLIFVNIFEKTFVTHIRIFIKRRKELQDMLDNLDNAPASRKWSNIKSIGKKLMNLKVDETPQQAEQKFQIYIANFVKKLRTKDELEAISLLQTVNVKEDPLGAPLRFREIFNRFLPTVEELELSGYVAEAIAKALNEGVSKKLGTGPLSHLPRFKKLLGVQSRSLECSLVRIQQQAQHILQSSMKIETPFIISVRTLGSERKLISLNTETSVKDAEVHRFWTQMNFGPNVRIQGFILKLRDYFTLDTSGSNDNWILDYINLTHVQPLVEALGDSISDTVCAQQVHNLAVSRPDGLSFSHWLTYWAAGWRINILNYRDQIYSVMRQMHDAFTSIHIANRAFIAVYLGSPFFIRIESLFRFITLNPGDQDASNDPRLVDLAYRVANLQEQEITSNLKDLSYILESPTEARLVGGPGRVETWILPLLYLLLQRHLSIITIAQSRVLDEGEMMAHTQSLVSIFRVFESRIKDIKATSKLEEKQEPEGQFQRFAHGMFHTYIDVRKSMRSDVCTLSTFRNAGTPPKYNHPPKEKINPVDLSILAKGPGQPFEYLEIDRTLSALEQKTHPLAGSWYSSCQQALSLQIYIRSFDADLSFTGNGETFLASVEISGEVKPETQGNLRGSQKVSFKVLAGGFADLTFKGQYNPEEDIIEGEITSKEGNGIDSVTLLSSDPTGCYALTFTRTPNLNRFKYLLAESNIDASWNKARSRWAFATQAVLYQVQSKMHSLKLLRRGLEVRRNWTATYLSFLELDVHPELYTGETKLFCTPPENVRLYIKLMIYLLEKRKADSIGGIQCDGCGKIVKVSRFSCITCRNESVPGSQVDLCSKCFETPQLKEGCAFAHLISHSLIRTSSYIPHFEFFELLRQAKFLSEDIKRSFREVDAGRVGVVSNGPSVSAYKCACCDADIALPCLACITCSLHPLFCLECDEKREYIQRGNASFAIHSRQHRFLRINDCEPVEAEAEAVV